MVEDRTQIEFPAQGATTVALCEPFGVLCCRASGPGGHPLRVLIDTGTDPSAVDARLVHRLALPTGGSGIGQGAANTVAFTEAVFPWLRLGNADAPGNQALTVRDLYAPALDLSGLPFAVDVVIGYSVLRHLTLRIDFRTRSLTLAHPDLGFPSIGSSGVVMPLSFFEHFPAIGNLVIDGVVIPQATIDTGSNAAITVGPDLAARLGLRRNGADVRIVRGEGFGGGGDVLRRRFDQVCLGPFTLTNIDIDAPLTWGGDLGRASRANIGMPLLARFATVVIDYGREQAGFEP
ncbi:aspartyl protease family protein [Roseiflexus castenholzii]|uniref:aspartyl protease family protein n=1 Tax=Roseiflexus castenholzii TaxID=120962 RepID=UPI003C7A556A